MTTFVEFIERDTIITVDGYSSAKSILGVMRDIEKEVAKIESVAFQSDCYSCNSKKEAQELLNTCTKENSCGGFYVEIEEVGCACQWNEEANEMKYKDGYNFYFCTTLVK